MICCTLSAIVPGGHEGAPRLSALFPMTIDRPKPGFDPDHLTSSDQTNEIAYSMADEIVESGVVANADQTDIAILLFEVFELVHEYSGSIDDFATLLPRFNPPGLNDWSGDCIALAPDEILPYAVYLGDERKAYRGTNVRPRRGWLVEWDFPEWGATDGDDAEWVGCDSNSSKFFIIKNCYRFLEAWVVLHGSPRRGLSWAGELYEIVNSQKETRGGRLYSLLLSNSQPISAPRFCRMFTRDRLWRG